MTFEEELEKLEKLTERLKDEKTPLEESIAIYEEAATLAKKLNKKLTELERRVEKVTSDADDPVLKTETIEEE